MTKEEAGIQKGNAGIIRGTLTIVHSLKGEEIRFEKEDFYWQDSMAPSFIRITLSTYFSSSGSWVTMTIV